MRALLLAVSVLLAMPAAVAAHASLVDSEPPAGGTVRGTPATLTATFDEGLDAARSRIVVRDAAGDEVARGGVGDEPTEMTVELPAGLAAGDYVARWTAVTPDDGGVTRGTIEFSVEAASITQPPAAPSPTARATAPAATSTPVASTPTADAATPPAAATPSLAPAGSPLPSPDPDVATGSSDLLLALVIAGVVVGGLAAYLLRR